jgi:hypothetical protein
MTPETFATAFTEGACMFSGRKKWSKRPGLVQVYVTSGLLQAQIIKGKLETNDIPVLLEYESLGPVMGLTVDGLGQVRVLVPEEKAETARALLEESELDDMEAIEGEDDDSLDKA